VLIVSGVVSLLWSKMCDDSCGGVENTIVSRVTEGALAL
jgi:hypothetical protein